MLFHVFVIVVIVIVGIAIMSVFKAIKRNHMAIVTVSMSTVNLIAGGLII